MDIWLLKMPISNSLVLHYVCAVLVIVDGQQHFKHGTANTLKNNNDDDNNKNEKLF
jgi:hypothetical protein